MTDAAALDPAVAPGGNFNLGVWNLQLPSGTPGSPTTIPSSRLKGAGGYTNPAYFFTDKTDGSMTFWAPEKGVTTPNSKYARSELRETNADGSAADWRLAGSHKLNATLRIPHVTKNGDIHFGTEISPAGGQDVRKVGHVPLGTRWSYTIAVSGGDRVSLTINGTTTSYPIPSSCNPYGMYFKAGSYNQSSSQSTSNGAKVNFYALTVTHG